MENRGFAPVSSISRLVALQISMQRLAIYAVTHEQSSYEHATAFSECSNHVGLGI